MSDLSATIMCEPSEKHNHISWTKLSVLPHCHLVVVACCKWSLVDTLPGPLCVVCITIYYKLSWKVGPTLVNSVLQCTARKTATSPGTAVDTLAVITEWRDVVDVFQMLSNS